MRDLARKYGWEIAGMITGAVAGLGYWYFVGCASGNCAITSSPINSSIYFGVMGSLAFSMLKGISVSKNSSNKHYE